MKRHEFDPAALVAGLVFLGLAAAYFLDASGVWDVSWGTAVAVTGGGLAAAWVTAAANRMIRDRRFRGSRETSKD